jgi:3-hydroxybutyryl-CoA dehydratase
MRIHELAVGMKASRRTIVRPEDIAAFAEISGDHNPVHLDQAFACATPFKGIVAHGMLSAGYISAVLGNDLPGRGAVYVGQTLSFRAPVRPGDEVETEVKITELVREKCKVTLATVCRVGEKVVLEGVATVLAAA